MATNPPPYSHISFELFTGGPVAGGLLFTGGPVAGGLPYGSVALTIVDHRCTTDPPLVLFPCPRNYSTPRHYRATLEDMATDLCCRRLHLLPCCVDSLVPKLVAKIAAVHRCCDVQSVELHVFPYITTADEILRELLEADEILMESFEAAQPKSTPTSLVSIEKLVAEKEGDELSCSSNVKDGESSCMICLDDIITRRSSMNMPCSHVFHETCIVEWLKVSHVCPLCRHEMPVEDDSAANSNH